MSHWPAVAHAGVMRKTELAVKLVPALAACLLGQGCVGAVVMRTRTLTFKPPSVGASAAVSAVSGAVQQGTDAPTAIWLEEHWGKPTSVRLASPESEGELWTYKFGRVWCGVVPWVVVPIPLVLPIGREQVVFLVQERDQVVSADVV